MIARNRLILAGTGIAIGLLLGFVLPSDWVFVDRQDTDHAGEAAGDTQYACPMFCTIMDQLPADHRCPVCGMEMTPVTAQTTLDERERRNIGLESEPLRRVPLARSIRVVGEVDYDETRLARITTRMSGWLERVWADTTWTSVRKGEQLASIYSPELYSAQKEYLVAVAARAEQDSETNRALLRSARRRLELLGIAAEDIEELAKQQSVRETLILRAPQAGVIIERHAVQGGSVKSGALLYTIADLSRVWVQTEVFERELAWIFENQPVRLRAEGSTAEIAGRVAFIDPVLDRRTRTARVRIEVDNPEAAGGTRLLRIGQRVDAWIDAVVDGEGHPAPPDRTVGQVPLSVPRSAVLSTGQRNVIYLLFTERDGRRDYRIDPANLPDALSYQMVPVRLGPLASEAGTNAADRYPLLGFALTDEERRDLQLDAAAEGMVVVTRGNLLLDSQAQLSGEPSLLFPEGSRGTSDPHAGH